MSRIRDGNNIKPPRNLIDLISRAQEAQLRSEGRATREYIRGEVVLEPDALRRALTHLSETRVNDTLLAEARVLAPIIERFRGGKAEHNEESLESTLGKSAGEARSLAKKLVEIGFLEEGKDTFKVPILYREGLEITQGKAFSAEGAEEEE